jgi:hypothetical protein
LEGEDLVQVEVGGSFALMVCDLFGYLLLVDWFCVVYNSYAVDPEIDVIDGQYSFEGDVYASFFASLSECGLCVCFVEL